MVFAFDKEILRSDIYQRVLRGSLKEIIRQKQADLKLFKTDSKTDKFLQYSQEQPLFQFNILIAGELQSKDAVLADILDSYEPISAQKCLEWRKQAKQLSAARLQTVIEAVTDADIKPQQMDLNSAARTLLRQLTANNPFKFEQRLAEAVEDFLESNPVQSLFKFPSAEIENIDSHFLYVLSLLALCLMELTLLVLVCLLGML